MEAISGRKTIREIAADHAIHPIQVNQWKRQLRDGASELFTRGKKTRDQKDGQAKEAELSKLVDHSRPELSFSRQCELLGLPRSTLNSHQPRVGAALCFWGLNSWVAIIPKNQR